MLSGSVFSNTPLIFHNKKPSHLPQKQIAMLILFLIFTQYQVLADQCITLHSKQNNMISCKICQSTPFSCNFYNFLQSQSLNRGDCISQCCNSNVFNNTNESTLCKTQLVITESSTVSVASIFMIVFFIIPTLICFIVCVISCYKKYRGRRYQENQQIVTFSAINLRDYNIDQLGPFFQDKGQTCSICLQNNCNIRTKCSHSFHSDCLKTWVNKKQSCPLCVNKQLNPILLYCSSCWKQSKMTVLREHMLPQQQAQWISHVQHRCEPCSKKQTIEQISINIEQSQQAVKKDQNDVNNVAVQVDS